MLRSARVAMSNQMKRMVNVLLIGKSAEPRQLFSFRVHGTSFASLCIAPGKLPCSCHLVSACPRSAQIAHQQLWQHLRHQIMIISEASILITQASLEPFRYEHTSITTVGEKHATRKTRTLTMVWHSMWFLVCNVLFLLCYSKQEFAVHNCARTITSIPTCEQNAAINQKKLSELFIQNRHLLV